MFLYMVFKRNRYSWIWVGIFLCALVLPRNQPLRITTHHPRAGLA